MPTRRTETPQRRAPKFRLGDRASEAARQAERQRYDLPDRPGTAMPQVPDDVTDLGDRALVNLMTDLTRWAEHLGVQLALAEVDERWADAALDKEKALASLAGIEADVDGGLAKQQAHVATRIKANAYKSQAVLEAEDKYHEAMAYRKLVGVLFTNAERWSSLLSRELTRRVNRDPRERRADRNST